MLTEGLAALPLFEPLFVSRHSFQQQRERGRLCRLLRHATQSSSGKIYNSSRRRPSVAVCNRGEQQDSSLADAHFPSSMFDDR